MTRFWREKSGETAVKKSSPLIGFVKSLLIRLFQTENLGVARRLDKFGLGWKNWDDVSIKKIFLDSSYILFQVKLKVAKQIVLFTLGEARKSLKAFRG